MRGSLKVAKIFNIPVYVHWSFGLIFLFVGYVGKSWDMFWFSSVFILALFVCVVLHEFGHALSAKKYGVFTHDITILPIGGVARLDRMPEKPIQEFVVAIAGPAVNVVIAGILGVLYIEQGLDNLGIDEIQDNSFHRLLKALLYSNIGLVIFNMIPAFPMDGGRVLRALLSMRLGRTSATRIAAVLGQFFAVLFLLYALAPIIVKYIAPDSELYAYILEKEWEVQPVLALISFFIFSTARNEYKTVKLDDILSRQIVNTIMRTHFTPLQTLDMMYKAATELKKGFESNFLVFDDTEILRGVLQEDDITDAIKNKHFEATISTYTTHDYERIKPFDTIKEAYQKMMTTGQYILPIFDDEQLLGVVDMKMIQNYIRIQEKLK